MTRRILAALTFSTALVSAAFPSFTSPRLHRLEFEQPHMGTLFRIVLYAEDAAAAHAGSRKAFERIRELEARLSDYREDSELSGVVRHAAERRVEVSRELFEVLRVSQAFAERTGGAFDVTAGALTHLWRRARRLGELPNPADVAAAREASGYRLMRLDRSARTVAFERAGVRIDLGGIGKGYAADRALACLRDAGFARALVAAGGDVAAGDPPPEREGWDVRLAGWDAHGATLVLSRAAVSTSGDLEQWLEAGGVRYSHILDPRTGRPLTERRLVTVIAPDATTSDMLATAASVLAGDAAMRLVEETPGAAARIGTADARERVTWRASSRWPL